ncbi:hypothetical protein ACN28S_43015 [Cystobacter fuscus]
MFSPSTQNGVIELLRGQAGIDKLFNPVKETRQNNLLEMPSAENEGAANELQQILGNTGEPLAEQLQSDTYGGILLQHFNEGKTFFLIDQTRSPGSPTRSTSSWTMPTSTKGTPRATARSRSLISKETSRSRRRSSGSSRARARSP